MLGKLLGFVFGYASFGIIGGILGSILGAYFEQGFSSVVDFQSNQSHPPFLVQKIFLACTFRTIAYIAKYDGRVSEQEIAAARKVMQHMNLSKQEEIRAISYFNEGKSITFNLDNCLTEFNHYCASSPVLKNMFIQFLLYAAYADKNILIFNAGVLEKICNKIHVPLRVLKRLQLQIEAEIRFDGFYNNQKSYRFYHKQNMNNNDDPYTILGVKRTDNISIIKKAYRRLMSENHPDKLIAKGVPPAMIKMATEKSQRIQAAYELIKNTKN